MGGPGVRRTSRSGTSGLDRLLSPRSIAVVGGDDAARAVEATRAIGFDGEVWAVNPRRERLAGLRCVPQVSELPAAPDAAFVSVPADRTVEVVAALRRRGAGGAACHASGFAETGAGGAARQRALVAAADGMPLLGPNCLGLVNYLDGAALWPDQHGGRRVPRGVGLVSQSGNVGLNLTMQRRGLPVAYLVTLGNQAALGVPEIVEAMLRDGRVSAIGLYLEAMPDPVALAAVAEAALRRRVPLAAVKVGATSQAAATVRTHTGSLAGSDAAAAALLRRLGIARADDLDQLLETLMLLHVHGSLPGRRVVSASCSGGEAALVADLAAARGVELPPLPEAAGRALRAALGERVALANPLDYHTYAWGDGPALRAVSDTLLGAGYDVSVLLLDLPRGDRCSATEWRTALEAFASAAEGSSGRGAVVSSLAGGLPEDVAADLVDRGVAPLHGLRAALGAVAAAAQVGAAQTRVAQTRVARIGPAGAGTDRWRPPAPPAPGPQRARWLDEAEAKGLLARAGIAVPAGRRVRGVASAVRAAEELGFPVAVKVLSPRLLHKSDAGGVVTGVGDADGLRATVARLRATWPAEDLLVEAMVTDPVAELLVGVRQEPGAGVLLTLGAGGALVELARDATSLLLPAGRAELVEALTGLRIWRLLAGDGARPAAELEAVVDAVARVGDLALDLADRLVELEVNPLIAGRRDAVAVDAVVRLADSADAGDPTLEPREVPA